MNNQQSSAQKQIGQRIIAITAKIFFSILCCVLIPIIIINATLMIKTLTSPNSIPSIFGYTPIIVQADTMEPAINNGDLILVKKVDVATLKAGEAEGDIIAYQYNGQVVTHRLVSTSEDKNGNVQYITKGDNEDKNDKYPLREAHIIGKLSTRVPGLGNFALFSQSPVGMVVLLGIPLVFVFLYDVVFRRKRQKNQPQLVADEQQTESEPIATDAVEEEITEVSAQSDDIETSTIDEKLT